MAYTEPPTSETLKQYLFLFGRRLDLLERNDLEAHESVPSSINDGSSGSPKDTSFVSFAPIRSDNIGDEDLIQV